MTRRIAFMVLTAVTLLLTGCQATPETPTVAGKGGEYIETMMNAESADDASAYDAPKSLEYELDHEIQGVRTHVRVSADVLVPEASASVATVSPADISFHAVSGLLNAVGPDRPIYDMDTCAMVEFKSDIQRQIDSYEQEMAAAQAEGADTSFYTDMLSQLYQAQAAAPDSVEEANAMLASGQLQPITVLTGGGFMSTPDEGTAVTNDRIEPFDLTSENYDDKYYHLILGMGTAQTATLTLNTRYDSEMPQIMEYTDTSSTAVPSYISDLSVMDGFPVSLDEAVSSAETVARSIDPGLRYYDAAAAIDGLRAAEDNETVPIGYQLFFTRDHSGVQTTYAVPGGDSDGGGRSDAVYSEDYPQEALVIVVTEKGIFSVCYTAPQTVSAVETENVRLLPFEEVKSVFDKNIVLTKGAGDLDLYIRIDHVRLGMMRIAQPNSRDFLVVPVWDFIGGSVTESEFTEHSDADYWNMIQDDPNVSYLTVNAINGAVISRSLGY